MSKKLSISNARNLIKRELGINATALIAPKDMNGNSDYPWYEMRSGTMRIEINTSDVWEGKHTKKMVCLCATRENSLKSTSEYFYGDNLEFAESYTEWKNREVYCENMEHPEIDAALRRLESEAIDDCWTHFRGKPNIQKEKALQRSPEIDAEEKEFWAMCDHLENGGDIADFDDTHLSDWAITSSNELVSRLIQRSTDKSETLPDEQVEDCSDDIDEVNEPEMLM